MLDGVDVKIGFYLQKLYFDFNLCSTIKFFYLAIYLAFRFVFFRVLNFVT